MVLTTPTQEPLKKWAENFPSRVRESDKSKPKPYANFATQTVAKSWKISVTNDNRISTICNFVNTRVIADIGSDHGFITKSLFTKNKIDFAYVTDISDKCLDKAKQNLADYSSQISFLCGDGLKVLYDTILPQKTSISVPQQVIIAGMGALEIKNILTQDKEHIFKNFILQPQKNVVQLRSFLIKNNFKIVQDVIVKNKKMFYNIINVTRTNSPQTLNEMELNFGKTNLENPSEDFISFVEYENEKCRKILETKKVKSVLNKLKMLEQINIGGKNV